VIIAEAPVPAMEQLPTPPSVEAVPTPPAAPPVTRAPDPVADPLWDGADAPELARAAEMLRKGQHGGARRELGAVLAALGPDGAPDLVLAAHAWTARACARLKDERCESAEIAAVTGLWARTDTGARILALGADDQAKRQRLGRALSAVGEALFLAAEQKRAAADRIALPVYHGSGAREEVLAFVNRKVGDWVRAKRPAIEEADKAYVKIVQLQPAPPPRWVVAAGARVGTMWASFTEEFRTGAPMPKEWKGDGPVPGASGLTYAELRTEYVAKLHEASEPQLAQARAAFGKCSEWARKFQIVDENGKACDAWLAAHPAKP
jgi:hypothetical protein